MCEFCQNHEQGDTLYEPSDWDGGIGFDYIRDIKYCPLCGKKLNSEDESTISKMEQVEDEPQMNPCDGCVCDDGKHLMYCMNCKGIAWKTEPPKVEDEPQTERSE